MKKTQKSWVKEISRELICFTQDIIDNDIPNTLFYILIVIEQLQLLYYCFISQLNMSSYGREEFKWLLIFLNPDHFIKQTALTAYILIPVFGLVTLFFIVITLAVYYNYYIQKSQLKQKKTKLSFLLNLIMVFYNTVLVIPIFSISATTIYCSQNSVYHHQEIECYGFSHIILCFISLFNTIWLAVVSLYFFLFYYSRNPFNYGIYSVSNNLWNGAKILLKIVPTIYLLVDEELKFAEMYVGGWILLTGGYIVVFHMIYSYYRYVFKLQLRILNIQTFFWVITAMHILLYFTYSPNKPKNIVFLYSFGIGVAISIICQKLMIIRKDRLALKFNSEEKDELEQVEEYFYYLNEYIELCKQNQQPVMLLKVVFLHRQKCRNPQCSCHQYFKLFNMNTDYAYKYEFMSKILVDLLSLKIQQHKFENSFKILRAYIFYYRLCRKNQAIYNITNVLSGKPSHNQQIAIYSLLYLFEKENSQESLLTNYIIFDKKIMELENRCQKLCEVQLKYWEELIDDCCSYTRCWKYITYIQSQRVQIKNLIQQLSKTFPKNQRLVSIRAHLAQYILYDAHEYEIYQYARNVIKKQKFADKTMEIHINFTQSAQLTVITSRLFATNTQIITCTKNVLFLLGFDKKHLIGSSVNKIIPKLYHEYHDKIINKYLEESDKKMQQLQRQLVVFALTIQDDLVKCQTVNKIIASQQYGYLIVSFFRRSNIYEETCIESFCNYYAIYDKETGIIDGVTMQLKNKLKLKQRKAKNTWIQNLESMNEIFPNWSINNETTLSNITENLLHTDHVIFDEIKIFRTDGPNQNIKIIEIKEVQETITQMNDKFQKTHFAIYNFDRYDSGKDTGSLSNNQSLSQCSIVSMKKSSNNLSHNSSMSLHHAEASSEIQHSYLLNQVQQSKQNKRYLKNRVLLALAICLMMLVLLVCLTVFILILLYPPKIYESYKIQMAIIQTEFLINRLSFQYQILQNPTTINIKLETSYTDLTIIQTNVAKITSIPQTVNEILEMSSLLNIQQKYDDTKFNKTKSYQQSTFQLVNTFRDVFTAIQNSNTLDTSDKFYIQNNAVDKISEFYEKLGVQMFQKIKNTMKNETLIHTLLLVLKIIVVIVPIVITVFYINVEYTKIKQILVLHSKLQLKQLSSLLQDCQNFAHLIKLQEISHKKKQSQSKKILSSKLYISKDKLQQQKQELLPKKVNFSEFPSSKKFIIRIVCLFLLLCIYEATYLYIVQINEQEQIEGMTKLNQQALIVNKCMEVLYDTRKVMNTQLQEDIQKLNIDREFLQNLLQKQQNLKNGNVSSLFLGKIQEISFMLKKDSNSIISSYKKFQSDFLNYIESIVVLLDNFSSVSVSTFFQNYLIKIYLLFAFEVILLLLLMKFMVWDMYTHTKQDRDNSEAMLNLLPEKTRLQMLSGTSRLPIHKINPNASHIRTIKV